jgi:hypothetical protein
MYKAATVFFSRDDVETIAHVIPTIDRIDSMLDDANSEPLAPSVKVALKFARKAMNSYYSKTDHSNVYRIAMGKSLCPHQLNGINILYSASPTTQT